MQGMCFSGFSSSKQAAGAPKGVENREPEGKEDRKRESARLHIVVRLLVPIGSYWHQPQPTL